MRSPLDWLYDQIIRRPRTVASIGTLIVVLNFVLVIKWESNSLTGLWAITTNAIIVPVAMVAIIDYYRHKDDK